MTSHHAICKFHFIESDWFSICFDFFASNTPLSRNNFRSAYDVFLLLTRFSDKLYRQSCLLLKYSAASFVSHYCW